MKDSQMCAAICEDGDTKLDAYSDTGAVERQIYLLRNEPLSILAMMRGGMNMAGAAISIRLTTTCSHTDQTYTN